MLFFQTLIDLVSCWFIITIVYWFLNGQIFVQDTIVTYQENGEGQGWHSSQRQAAEILPGIV